MRIALLTDAWAPQMSGAAMTLDRMAQELSAGGDRVEVVHPGLFQTIPCPTYPDIRLALRPGPRLSEILEEFQPQSIHIPVEGPIGLAGRRYCLRHGLRFTTSFMTKFPEYIQDRFKLPPQFLYRLFRWFHGAAARTMVSTPSLKQDLESKGFGNLVFWGRGVDHELFRPRGERVLDVPRPVSMYMGRVAVEKNIQAFLDLDLPGTKVAIGDGPALRTLQKAYPQALFLGRKTGEDLACHLADADVFVFPSLTDTFGIVLIEAMACGVPVAAYPVVGPKDVVLHGSTGWLDQDLQTAVDRALGMDPQACRDHALQFTWARSVEQFRKNLVSFARGKAD